MTHYALYHGDNFLDIGTTKELSKKFGLSESTIRTSSYPSAIKRFKGKGYIAVKVDDEPRKEKKQWKK